MKEMDEGERRKLHGQQMALFGADNKHPDWSERAYIMAKEYVRLHPETAFLTEDLRYWAYVIRDFPKPENQKAWGGIMRKAAMEKIIKKIGTGKHKDPRCHKGYATIWISYNSPDPVVLNELYRLGVLQKHF